MALTINKSGSESVTVSLIGRLDTTTAPQLEKELDGILASAKELVFDFAGLEYISSAGLRILLKSQKAMNKQGSMKLKNVSDDIKEIFEITGFLDFLTIE